ncbi:MAG: hypothetical protein ACRDHG_13725 [Anaerolineales bacterium]
MESDLSIDQPSAARGTYVSPTEFLARMGTIFKEPFDNEHAHAAADRLLWETLDGLGYAQGVALMREQELWYA